MFTEKMSPNESIAHMIRYVNVDDKEKFYEQCEKHLATLSPNGDYYHQIKRALSSRPLNLRRMSELSQDVKKFIRASTDCQHPVYLPDYIKIILDELLQEWSNAELFKKHNLGVRNRILLYGPSGNGKTTIARHIANIANLPFVEVNTEALISSHVGVSSNNIEKFLTSVSQPCVLFWDEVDSLAKSRSKGGGNSAEHENDRIVNTLLINLDKLHDQVVFVCATNRFDILDTAFLRRMQVNIEIEQPSITTKFSFFTKMFDHYRLPDEMATEAKKLKRYNNLAEIKDAMEQMARAHVLRQLKSAS